MTRHGLAHFHRNVGIWGIRGVVVTGVMLALGVHAWMREGQALPLAVFFVAKYAGYALLGIAASSSAWIDRVDDDNGAALLGVMLGVVGLYLSAWFAVCSDRTVITAYAQRQQTKRDGDLDR